MSPVLVNPSRFGAAPPAAVAFVNSSASTGTGGTSITKPSGLSTGDWLLIACEENSATLTITSDTFLDLGTYAMQGSNRAHIFARQIDGTEGSTFTASATTNWKCVAYSGVVGIPALIGGVQTGATIGITSINSRYRAPVDGVVVHMFFSSANSSPVVASPAGTNDRGGWATRTFWAVNISDETVTAGDDNTRTATESGGSSPAALSLAFILPSATNVPAAVGSATNSGNSTNASLTIPSAAQVGDLFVCCFSTIALAGAISAGPTGFTAIDGPGNNTGGTQRSNYWWGYKILASGDPGSSINVTSGSQVWGSAGVVIRNPNATPIGVTGTMTNGTSTTPPLVGPSTTPGRLAISGFMFSNGASQSTRTLDTATIQGVIWRADTANGSGFGGAGLAVHSVPPSGSGLTPTVTLSSSPTWETNTVLLSVG